MDSTASCVYDLVVSARTDSYQITGLLQTVGQDTAVYCVVYQEDGRLLRLGCQTLQASSQPQRFSISVAAGDTDRYLRVSVLDSGISTPLGEMIQRSL